MQLPTEQRQHRYAAKQISTVLPQQRQRWGTVRIIRIMEWQCTLIYWLMRISCVAKAKLINNKAYAAQLLVFH